MRRGELYLVRKPGTQDPKRQRVFVVASREALLSSKFSSVVCAPVYSRHDGLSTQVRVGVDEGLKQDSSIHCDELVSLSKAMLTNYVGGLSESKLAGLNRTPLVALDLDEFVWNA